jgi:hypothetical protein
MLPALQLDRCCLRQAARGAGEDTAMIETMSNAQSEETAGDLAEQVVSEAIDALYEGMLAIARFGRRQPLVVAGLGAAVALAFVALKPSARKAVMDTASGLVDSLRRTGSDSGSKAQRRTRRAHRRAHNGRARAKRATRAARHAQHARM